MLRTLWCCTCNIFFWVGAEPWRKQPCLLPPPRGEERKRETGRIRLDTWTCQKARYIIRKKETQGWCKKEGLRKSILQKFQCPHFQELWILIHGLTTSFRPLMWTVLIATIVLYLGGLAATEIIGKAELFKGDEDIDFLFGDLLKSMYTMIQLLTLDTWADTIARFAIDPTFNPLDRPYERKGWFPYSLFFIFFIGIGVFVFWNLITAIIVETAFAISDSDSNSQAREIEMAKRAEIESLTQSLSTPQSWTISDISYFSIFVSTLSESLCLVFWFFCPLQWLCKILSFGVDYLVPSNGKGYS